MTSKRTAAGKRTPLPRAADYAKSFLKDWDRLTQAGRYDMNRLKEAMLLLIANALMATQIPPLVATSKSPTLSAVR